MDKSATLDLFANFSRFGDRPALVDDQGRVLSYATLDVACERAAAALASDRKRLIFVPCRNDIESVVGYICALRSGHVVLLADATMAGDLREGLLGSYAPDYAWTSGDGVPGVEQIFGGHGFQKREVREDHAPIHPSLALLMATSGSTGSPKYVRLTLLNLESNAGSIARYLNISRDDRPVTSLPIHYSYGLSVLNSHLRVGATVLLTSLSVTNRRFWEFFNESCCTSMAGVPYTYEMLRQLRFENMTLPTLRYMTQAGGRLSPELAVVFAENSRERGYEFYLMYGQTEATARMAYLAPAKNMLKPASVGSAIPGGQMLIVDAEGRLVDKPCVEGQIVYKGENVMMGYAAARDDLGKGDELHGVLHTGDTGRFDEDGDFYITGRLRRFIKLLGRRVNLDDLEAYLATSGLGVACGGKDDLLLVATTEPARDEAIKRQLLASFKITPNLVRIVHVDRLSRNASGKINYGELFLRVLKGASNGG